jgi:DNA end-binding protein Ku
MAKQLVDSMAMEWDPAQFHDTYREDLMRMIHERAEAGEETVSVANVEAPEPRVLDLMAALKGSLAAKAKESVGKRRKSSSDEGDEDSTSTTDDDETSTASEDEDEAPETKKASRGAKRAGKAASRKSA